MQSLIKIRIHADYREANRGGFDEHGKVLFGGVVMFPTEIAELLLHDAYFSSLAPIILDFRRDREASEKALERLIVEDWKVDASDITIGDSTYFLTKFATSLSTPRSILYSAGRDGEMSSLDNGDGWIQHPRFRNKMIRDGKVFVPVKRLCESRNPCDESMRDGSWALAPWVAGVRVFSEDYVWDDWRLKAMGISLSRFSSERARRITRVSLRRLPR